LAKLFAEQLQTIAESVGELALVYVITLFCSVLTELCSSIAIANLMMAALSSIAYETLDHPMLLLLPAAVGVNNAFLLPAATPPNAVIFATERVPIRSFFKAGRWLNFLSLLISPPLVYALGSAVYGALDPYPRWACTPFPEECRYLNVPGIIDGQRVASQACALIGGAGVNFTCQLRNGTFLNR